MNHGQQTNHQVPTQRKRKNRKSKRSTRMSVEIQKLKDQLYDEKNFKGALKQADAILDIHFAHPGM